jgi:predicted secreted protein
MLRSCALLLSLLLCSAALAADGAKFRAIGFSPDTQHFAFEQYGVQDGSGFAYTDVFILDIAKDKWVKGTPVNELLEDETGSVAAVRAKAKSDAAAFLKSANITLDAELLAANPFTEVVADRTTLTFHDHYNNAMGVFGTADNQGSWELKASKVKVPLPEGCEADMDVSGYKLELKNNKSGETTLLHEDKSLPKSRFCALAYDIEAVVQPAGGSESGQLVAIIGVSRRGFEGADRRFIAVPFKFN